MAVLIGNRPAASVFLGTNPVQALHRGSSANLVLPKGFDPVRLFSHGEDGTLLDAKDASTLFQDADGLTPFTAPGQAVARMRDKSGNGRDVIQATASARPLGLDGYLQNDGVDDFLHGEEQVLLTPGMSLFASFETNSFNSVAAAVTLFGLSVSTRIFRVGVRSQEAVHIVNATYRIGGAQLSPNGPNNYFGRDKRLAVGLVSTESELRLDIRSEDGLSWAGSQDASAVTGELLSDLTVFGATTQHVNKFYRGLLINRPVAEDEYEATMEWLAA